MSTDQGSQGEAAVSESTLAVPGEWAEIASAAPELAAFVEIDSQGELGRATASIFDFECEPVAGVVVVGQFSNDVFGQQLSASDDTGRAVFESGLAAGSAGELTVVAIGYVQNDELIQVRPRLVTSGRDCEPERIAELVGAAPGTESGIDDTSPFAPGCVGTDDGIGTSPFARGCVGTNDGIGTSPIARGCVGTDDGIGTSPIARGCVGTDDGIGTSPITRGCVGTDDGIGTSPIARGCVGTGDGIGTSPFTPGYVGTDDGIGTSP